MATDAKGIDTTSLEAIDGLVEQALEEEKMPGAVVMIGHAGEIVFHRAYGHRQLQPERLPMKPDTVFDMASITKPVATATSVMILRDRGEICLHDKVSKHLPEFAANEKQDITIEQLLLHVGGMIPDNSLSEYKEGRDKAVENLLNIGLNYEPGKRFRYSDVGFQILGELVHRVTGKTVHEFSQEAIFQPLGMQETGYLPPEKLQERAATTEQREGRWMRGEVHDPRAYAMDGIAGHAGLFSTATDLAVYAQMMINQGAYGGVSILSPATVRTMTAGYSVPQGQRGLGWDKRSGYSSNRGATMSPSAFGHGGFTGTAMWIDPELELFVIFLSNRVHPNGKGSVNPLAGAIGTIAADAVLAAGDEDAQAVKPVKPENKTGKPDTEPVLCGVDVLERDGAELLRGRKIGLITNHTGVTRSGKTTGEFLAKAPAVNLVALFSPEHGFAGKLDQSDIGDTIDPVTGVKVFSLYGASRKPTDESLEGIDTLVFDIQDIGTRFYTYISTMGGAMEVAAEKGIRFVVLDRPNPINGVDIAGPVLDEGEQTFVGYHTLPVRHGMTTGELAKMLKSEKYPELDLQVIECEGWQRDEYFDATGLYWINPSPNMRNLNQAILYPGIGLLEYTNLSVGRGTDTPFEHIGAPWIDAGKLASDLNALDLPGVTFIPERFTPESSKYEGEVCEGIQILITDREQIEPLQVGFAIALALHRDYPEDWDMKPYARLLNSSKTYQAIDELQSLEQVREVAAQGMKEFKQRRDKHLLY
ncbi:exo-beta-N-acetylmuramidase NamZ domain-containing protein [Candidatus Laterigemmans baculatus]|uniref:exo-beta-N-acetylmuramidase NamZ domain-containing protein n=1 Tax=Candidatus Laterigemmans baculatus TaxID=2770505 RepID=UPI0013D987DE|nr:exo-beta-N-acetylmuramidase NamZ domain-containing protein [Candidatus Laterigemmans baculatus]